MISEAELRWGPTVRAIEGVVRVVCRWAVLLAFVVVAWFHGASSEASANAQILYDARYGQQMASRCLSASGRALDAGERAGAMMNGATFYQRWVIAMKGRGEMVAGR